MYGFFRGDLNIILSTLSSISIRCLNLGRCGVCCPGAFNLYQPEITTTGPIRFCIACKNVPSVRSLLDRANLLTSQSSKCPTPLRVTARVCLDEPYIITNIKYLAFEIRILGCVNVASEYISTVCSLMNRISVCKKLT
uniref:Uncharacterized protein n=1 Tax=Candidatus Methanogaster sp. ANME-2c ERB4 TaxID=2759911 RepID=A0A7G9Y195_9EURY|nr:hypothetical protein PIKABMHP_00020 [Methanosarcinales archaeon ANME-2c ERB4]